jgi:DNA-binding transcriptional ArsR family regulator
MKLFTWVEITPRASAGRFAWRGFFIVHLMVNRSPELDLAFAALSHPIRRRIVERLARGPATVGQAAAGTGVSKAAISKHLRVLEEAKVIVRVIEGRQHRLSLNGGPLDGASGWLERQRQLWERKFDVVEDYLEERKR